MSDTIFPKVYNTANFAVFPTRRPIKEPKEIICSNEPTAKHIANPIILSLMDKEGKILSLLSGVAIFLIMSIFDYN